MKFDQKVAIVTGGTRGIGKAIAEAFLESGASVIATYASNDQSAHAFKEEMARYGERIQIKKFDVSSIKECTSFFEDISKKHEQIHILINNSGIRKDNLAASMTQEEWNDVININLRGTFNMTQQGILHMMKHRFGRIINISSIGASLGLAGQANYAASKAGQIALSKSMSKEVAKRKITINNVCPGFIETQLIDDLESELLKDYKAKIPMKRFGKPEEVAHAVLFLASDKASYITGASLEVSGGL